MGEDLTPLLEALEPMLLGTFLVLVRLGSLVYWLPGLASGSLPPRVRATIVLIFTGVICMGQGGVFVEMPNQPLVIGILMSREVVIGAAMGMAIRLLFTIMEVAGSLAGISMGLSMNIFVDPASGDQSLSLGGLLGIAAALIFVTMDGHRVVLMTMFEHLQLFPVGILDLQVPGADTIARAGTRMIDQSLQLAAPAVVTTLILNVALAFITRVVPTANLFGIGLGAMLLCGLLALSSQSDAVVILMGEGIESLPRHMLELTGMYGGS
jgi:flagellar biosynthetic protein FliR